MCGFKRALTVLLFGMLLCGVIGCGKSEQESDLPPDEQAKAILDEARSNTPNYPQAVKMTEELEAIGQDAVPVLMAAVDDENWRVRQIAAESLGRIGADEACEALVQQLRNEPDERVRSVLPRALGNIGNAKAVDVLIETMQDDPDAGVRQMAATALGELQDHKAVGALILVLDTGDPRVVREAMTSLAKIGDPAALEPLIAKTTASRLIRLKAVESLGRLGDHRAYDTLVKALQEGNGEMKATAAGALGDLGDPRAVEHLVKVLHDGDENSDARTAAARALGQLGTEEAVEALKASKTDEHEYVRLAVERALKDAQKQ